MYKFLMFLLLATFIPFGAKAATIYPGDLIKSPSFSSVYYYSEDGKRHAFPSESVFYSWYDGFEDIRIITDEELGSIALGKNVTMRPGTKLIKVMTDPKVYAVDGRNLRPISTEAVAESIWGSDWAKNVVDISDVFFTNYETGEVVDSTDGYNILENRGAYLTINSIIVEKISSSIPTIVPDVQENPTAENPIDIIATPEIEQPTEPIIGYTEPFVSIEAPWVISGLNWGDSIKFTVDYETRNVISCVASGDWTGNKILNGHGSEEFVIPFVDGSEYTKDYKFVLTCDGENYWQTGRLASKAFRSVTIAPLNN